MLTLYDVKEFATAVKPSLLRTLLAGGAAAAMYLDPDIVVFARSTRSASWRRGTASC